MKLARIRTAQGIKPAALDAAGTLRDLSSDTKDITPDHLSPEALALLEQIDLSKRPEITGGYAPILSGTPRLICVGLNYSDHAAEMNMDLPEFPVLFMKACAPTGADDPIILPKGSTKTDWEVELGLVIGTGGVNIEEADAMNHIAGYCVANDVSERSFQNEMGGQWMKGKSSDSFGPIGPWLVTREAVEDVQNLSLYLDVNGVRKQTGSTTTMIFSVAHVVSFISRFVTLRRGDVILTGTPPGVGAGMTPPEFLKPGDVVTLGIEGLGDQRHEVRAFEGG